MVKHKIKLNSISNRTMNELSLKSFCGNGIIKTLDFENKI